MTFKFLSRMWVLNFWSDSSVARQISLELTQKATQNAQSSWKWRPTETFFAESLGGVKIFHFTSTRWNSLKFDTFFLDFFLFGTKRVNNVKVLLFAPPFSCHKWDRISILSLFLSADFSCVGVFYKPSNIPFRLVQASVQRKCQIKLTQFLRNVLSSLGTLLAWSKSFRIFNSLSNIGNNIIYMLYSRKEIDSFSAVCAADTSRSFIITSGSSNPGDAISWMFLERRKRVKKGRREEHQVEKLMICCSASCGLSKTNQFSILQNIHLVRGNLRSIVYYLAVNIYTFPNVSDATSLALAHHYSFGELTSSTLSEILSLNN